VGSLIRRKYFAKWFNTKAIIPKDCEMTLEFVECKLEPSSIEQMTIENRYEWVVADMKAQFQRDKAA